MCTNPGTLPNGQQFACRKCEQCRDHYVEDWVGRCIAEGQVSVGWNTITLTYSTERSRYYDNRDIVVDQRKQAAYLTYKDVQLYLKTLRNKGFPCRYFVVGEYGSKRGRAHWHVICFWQKKIPPHELRSEFYQDEFWRHGYSYWDEGKFTDSVKYVLKYLHKTKGDDAAQSKFMMSKKPPLGAEYFELLAQRYVDQRLPISDTIYSFGDVRRKNGMPIKFRLARHSADAFLAAYVRRYRQTYGHDNWPYSEVVERFCDRQANYVPLFKVDTDRRFYRGRPWTLTGDTAGEPVYFSQAHNCFFVEREGKQWFWSFDKEGRRAWLDVIRGEPLEVVHLSKSRQSGFNEYSARKDGTYWETQRKRR